MLSDHWPLRRLQLTTDRLILRLPDEEELAALADVAASGVHEPGEQPFLQAWTNGTPEERARRVLQSHWGSMASWTPQDWELPLGVFRDGVPIGIVALRGRDFAILREVKTWSWLGLPHHSQGFGTESRRALLHLAFDGLGAEAALTEAFQDNAGSQGVSRKLGYRPDGISRDVLHGRAVVSDRLRLTREDWRPAEDIRISGLDECRAFFIA
ncbi:N-acetyltransferase [Kribbella turkmenica]|uniref:N-acetyltransferase n=1 Tax=Kribbella turkmenica TaxID=2530375 RepID=A0A4R4XBS3_9ACTN|nr:GNAT family protein [Kribbella turkmenica]TDD28005.1 N-acetyltransferase [Kribbella turkmenica]